MTLIDVFGKFLEIIAPILYGVAITYLLSPILNFIERKILRFPSKKAWVSNLRRVLAIILTLVFLLLVLAAAVSTFIPQIIDSYKRLSALLSQEDVLNAISDRVDQYIDNQIEGNSTLESAYAGIRNFLGLDKEQSITGKLFEYIWHYVEGFFSKSAIENLLNKLWGAGSVVVSFVFDTIVTTVLCLYLLFTKEKQLARVKKLVNAFFKPKTADKIYHIAYLTDDRVGRYLRVQVFDSILVGVISYFAYMIAGIPFYPVLALISGVTNIIPYFGPFIGAVPNGIFILISDPSKLLPFIIIVLIIQQIDGNILVPLMQSNNMKMDVFWVLAGMTIMGGIFGLPGMILGVPLFSVIYILVKERAEEKLTERNLPLETDYYSQSRRPNVKVDHRPPFVIKISDFLKGKKKEKLKKELPDSGTLLEFDDDQSLPEQQQQNKRNPNRRNQNRQGQKGGKRPTNPSFGNEQTKNKEQVQKDTPANAERSQQKEGAREPQRKGNGQRGRRKNSPKEPSKEQSKEEPKE